MSLDLANISRYSKTKFKNIFLVSVIYKYIKTIFLAIASDSMQTLKTFTVVFFIYVLGITAAVATIKSSLDKSTAIQCHSGQVQAACNYLAGIK
tara:strand:- start:1323 stop:1604 length:282 start_codon:yes stop_codon:yes gene_type:complete